MTEKYEHLKSESDQKSSKISEVKVGPLLATFLARNYILSFFLCKQLEEKLQNSQKALETQEQNVKELRVCLQI